MRQKFAAFCDQSQDFRIQIKYTMHFNYFSPQHMLHAISIHHSLLNFEHRQYSQEGINSVKSLGADLFINNAFNPIYSGSK